MSARNDLDISNSNSTYNREARRANFEAMVAPTLASICRAPITRDELENRELLTRNQLTLAIFKKAPAVRVQELQKQLLLLKIEKAGIS